MRCTTKTRTALYRFYDAHENLLYVGITNKPGRRWQQHMEEKSWYPLVKHQAVTWYDSEAEARRAEALAIRSERPKFNVVGAIRPAESRLNLRGMPLGGFAVIWLCIPGVVCAVARFAPALDPLAALAILGMPLPLLAAIVIRSTPLIYRFGCWLDRNFGPEPAAAAPVRSAGFTGTAARILALVAAGHTPSKAGKLAGRSDSYGRKVVRTARELAAAAPAGQELNGAKP